MSDSPDVHDFHDSPQVASVINWLVKAALANERYGDVYCELCDELVKAQLPVLRCHLAMNTLHPLVESVGLTWVRGKGVTIGGHVHGSNANETWLRSPLYWMLSNRLSTLRQDLTDSTVTARFPALEDFAALGGTDYLALVTHFGDAGNRDDKRDGIVTSWVSDRPGGFSDKQIEALKYMQPYIALVAKLSQQQHTASNVVSAYLGNEVGRRVLKGQIQLGNVECIPAVIWLCDLRDSTAMAEQVVAADFLQSLNAYFDCTAGAVVAHGGQILHFLGDAVLAIFPITENAPAVTAAQQALQASQEARRRMAALNLSRLKQVMKPLEFGLGLHVGDVLYGNIGIPDRIEFSVIGSAVNEVSRLEGLTKEVGEPMLVSKAFKSLVDKPWRNLGTFQAKGVEGGLDVYALAH